MTPQVKISPKGRPGAAEIPRSPRSWRRVDPRPLGALVVLLGGVSTWSVATAAGWTDAETFPSPGTVFATGRGLVTSGRLAVSAGLALHEVARGVLWGTVLGVLLAVGIARSTAVTHRTTVVDTLVRIAPGGGLLLVGLVLLTRNESSSIAAVAISSAIPVGLHTLITLHAVSRHLDGTTRSYKPLPLPVALRAVLSGAAIGVRVATGAAWATVAIIATVGAAPGLESFDPHRTTQPSTAGLVVHLAMFAVLAAASDVAVRLAVGRVLAWRASRHPLEVPALERNRPHTTTSAHDPGTSPTAVTHRRTSTAA